MSEITCPYCGSERTGPTGHPEFKSRCFADSCSQDWNDDDPLVKRIRALEAERDEAILDAKMWKQVANLLDNKAKRLQADNARLAGEVSILEAEVALPQGVLVELRTNEEIARLAGELAQARAEYDRLRKQLWGSETELTCPYCEHVNAFLPDRSTSWCRQCGRDLMGERIMQLESSKADLRARLAEAEKRVGEYDTGAITDGAWYWYSYGEKCYGFGVVEAIQTDERDALPEPGSELEMNDEGEIFGGNGTRMLVLRNIAEIESQDGDAICRFIAKAHANAFGSHYLDPTETEEGERDE